MQSSLKRPRHYAADICELKTKEQRREYLETKVPDHLRELTAAHVLARFGIRKGSKK